MAKKRLQVDADDDTRRRLELRAKTRVAAVSATELRALHERILAHRDGRPIDLGVLTLMREERDDDLNGLR